MKLKIKTTVESGDLIFIQNVANFICVRHNHYTPEQKSKIWALKQLIIECEKSYNKTFRGVLFEKENAPFFVRIPINYAVCWHESIRLFTDVPVRKAFHMYLREEMDKFMF